MKLPKHPIALLRLCAALLGPIVLSSGPTAHAQDLGTLDPKPLPPLAHPESLKTPAKELFARKATPAPMEARAIGFYAKGCLAGAVALPINGKTWQVMRLSRNRNWGHPSLVELLERLADQAPKTGWRGLLLGDMSQPRGGPLLAGHTSHQVGLDSDIWLTPMPDHELTREERENMMATMVVAENRKDVDSKVWTSAHFNLIKVAAEDPVVARIFVNAAIKKALCRDANGDRAWLSKVQPWWGHDWHFHVRLHCPADSPDCTPQPDRPADDGCGKALDSWLAKAAPAPKPDAKPVSRPGPKMSQLPAACRQVLLAQ
jgi:penicillin-insensitive murein endopeptidase